MELCIFDSRTRNRQRTERAGTGNCFANHSGDNVWIGTNVFVLPGVTIGNNTIIGAGSVVNKNIPDGVIAAGNPCKIIRKITDSDKKKISNF